ncbi:hypothetical protein D1007_20098 [Hordeum vulgare]|nr:hypothetical protein D1007_20098 [Hordeum vulgare]
MEDGEHLSLWLQVVDWCNGPSLVAVNFSMAGFMSFTPWWKLFTCSHDMRRTQLVQFKYDGAATLFVKFFGVAGDRIECSTKSENGSGCDCSSGSKSDGSPRNIKSEEKDSD